MSAIGPFAEGQAFRFARVRHVADLTHGRDLRQRQVRGRFLRRRGEEQSGPDQAASGSSTASGGMLAGPPIS